MAESTALQGELPYHYNGSIFEYLKLILALIKMSFCQFAIAKSLILLNAYFAPEFKHQ